MNKYERLILELKEIEGQFGSESVPDESPIYPSYARSAKATSSTDQQVLLLLMGLTLTQSMGALPDDIDIICDLEKELANECSSKMKLSALLGIAEYYIAQRAFINAFEYADRAFALSREMEQEEWEVDALTLMSKMRRNLGQKYHAQFYIGKAVKIGKKLPHSLTYCQAITEQGHSHLVNGQFQDALDCYALSISVAESISAGIFVVEGLLDQVGVFRVLGDIDRAISLFFESLRVCRKYKIKKPILEHYKTLGLLLLDEGQFELTLNLYEYVESLLNNKLWGFRKDSGKLHSGRPLPFIVLGRGNAYIGLGQLDVAVHNLKKAIDSIENNYLGNLEVLTDVLRGYKSYFGKTQETQKFIQIEELLPKLDGFYEHGFKGIRHIQESELMVQKNLNAILGNNRHTYLWKDTFIDLSTRRAYFDQKRASHTLLPKKRNKVFQKLLDNINTTVDYRDILDSYDDDAYTIDMAQVQDRVKHMIIEIRKQLHFSDKEPIVNKRGKGYKLIDY